MAIKTYTVHFTIKRNRQEYGKETKVKAINLKEARKEFERQYFKQGMNVPHPFHIKITLDKYPREEFYAKCTKKFKVTFSKPEFDAVWTFIRDKTAMYAYGNKTAVTVFCNEELRGIVDTRYDKLVCCDFHEWCMEYLRIYFDPIHNPCIEEIKEDESNEAR